jgi:hypothetical protein
LILDSILHAAAGKVRPAHIDNVHGYQEKSLIANYRQSMSKLVTEIAHKIGAWRERSMALT